MLLLFGFVVAVVAGAIIPSSASVPSVPLYNAARHGVMMPVTGLGTGSYGSYYHNETEVEDAVYHWLKAGGRRIDASLSYNDQVPVGRGIKRSGIPREEIFITSKVGPTLPLGYKDTMSQFEQILQTLDTTYVDLLLIHWPGPSENSTDPACAGVTPKLCRQSTWKALEAIYTSGGARAIGVSNFEVRHLDDITSMHGLLPAVNQVEYHPFWHEEKLVEHCHRLNITFNGYSPLGTPDVSPSRCGWNLLADETLNTIAKKHDVDVSQVILRWEHQKGILVNPRTKNTTHMHYNLNFFHFSLSDSEMDAIAALKAPTNRPKITPDPAKIP
ncbi:hypothetical protein PTSG_03640 [Salpingoeca rosetta]|uniref:NADP-dependent oxidoreductase domain-containing protein n=1 Tax=Salpingoeca rosetta (strain ATCC 50818 / BSB-021) TaxID=946362 RepID=F2U663_SALR5|nr:uncharacterized protein PTSG_03640 [Salpingoeca rosetta]EGD83004.1 hypothetical protein PTSG_03640 [Salpingoeca rosetta]|eukprot:XP_004995368.1 hypothetical protein PTSG_03640 [Salpingoeca rosetta]